MLGVHGRRQSKLPMEALRTSRSNHGMLLKSGDEFSSRESHHWRLGANHNLEVPEQDHAKGRAPQQNDETNKGANRTCTRNNWSSVSIAGTRFVFEGPPGHTRDRMSSTVVPSKSRLQCRTEFFDGSSARQRIMRSSLPKDNQ